MVNELDNKMVTMAEAVRAEILFDISVKLDPFYFGKLVLQKTVQDAKKLCSLLYKYANK